MKNFLFVLLSILISMPALSQDNEATQLSYADIVANSSPVTPGKVAAALRSIIKSKPSYIGVYNTSGTNTYSVTITDITSLTSGLGFINIKIGTQNTGASTLNVGVGGNIPIVKDGSNTPVAAGDLKTATIYTVCYNGTAFQLQGGDSKIYTPGNGLTLTGTQFSLGQAADLTSDVTLNGHYNWSQNNLESYSLSAGDFSQAFGAVTMDNLGVQIGYFDTTSPLYTNILYELNDVVTSSTPDNGVTGSRNVIGISGYVYTFINPTYRSGFTYDVNGITQTSLNNSSNSRISFQSQGYSLLTQLDLNSDQASTFNGIDFQLTGGAATVPNAASITTKSYVTTQNALNLKIASNLSDLANKATAQNNLLPTQTSQSGKFLTTNGTNVSWANAVAANGNGTTVSTNKVNWGGTTTADVNVTGAYEINLESTQVADPRVPDVLFNMGSTGGTGGDGYFNLSTSVNLLAIDGYTHNSTGTSTLQMSSVSGLSYDNNFTDNTTGYSSDGILALSSNFFNVGLSSSNPAGYNIGLAMGSGFSVGSNLFALGNKAITFGTYAQGIGDYSFAHGLGISTKVLRASGTNSFIFSENTTSQTFGHGAQGRNSVILGGQDANIPSACTGCIILGGTAIKAPSTGSNIVLADKLRILNNSFFGSHGTTPSALIHFAAASGAAGSGSLKFNAGTLLSTPETGLLEFDGTHFYITIGSTRYQLDQQSGGGGGGTGTVTNFSVVTANGVSASVATSTTTPAATFTLGAITPSSVNSVVISGSSTPTLAVTGTTSVSGTNTGDQTISDATLTTSNITTNNVSITKHGFVPIAPNDATVFLNGTGAWSAVTDASLSTSNVTTNDVSITKHGFTPIAPNDATKFLNGVGAWAAVSDASLSTTNVTTNDVSITKHGFAPIAPNDATKFLNGTGAWTVPSPSMSNFSPATAQQVLNNGNNMLTWAWNSLANLSGMKLSSTSTQANGNANKLLEVTTSGANGISTQTTWAGYFSNAHSGTSSTTVGLYSTASGGTNNYAGIFDAGRVGFGVTAPLSKVDVVGSVGMSIATTSTDITLDDTYFTVEVDATAANRTITLPAAASNTRRIYKILKIDSGANTVTIDANGSELINSSLTKVLSTQWAGYEIHCDGTKWVITATF